MITNPVFIVGAPRSGTSLLFHVLRTRFPFWSLPSEGQHIWDLICHPSLNNWSSEECHTPSNMNTEQRACVISAYEEQVMPQSFWRIFGNPKKVWQSQPTKNRKAYGELYLNLSKFIYHANPIKGRISRRLLDKTASNSLRLELLADMFPDACFIHIKRSATDTITSMVRGWQNSERFFTFHVPEHLSIVGYEGDAWKFMLPEDWREFKNRHIVDVCAWQWKICQERILHFRDRTDKPFLEVKAENLYTTPSEELKRVADFLGFSHKAYKAQYGKALPVVNATMAQQHAPYQARIKSVINDLRPLLERLGYE